MAKPSYAGPVIDVDIHQRWRAPQEILERLPRRWREYVAASPTGARTALLPAGATYPFQRGVNKRLDALPEDGATITDYSKLRSQLLDPYNVEVANLTFDIGQEVCRNNPYLSGAIARAMNDWVLETWVPRDARLRTAIVVPTAFPEEGAEEIHRLGDHPGVSEVLFSWNGLGKPLGFPAYDPIYRAAEEHGLPIAIHGAAGEVEGGAAQTAGGGLPNSRLEWHTLLQQPTLTHFASFVAHGTFEKFPNLRVLLVETGVAWVPGYLWSLDTHYPALRAESDWVRRLPSEYFRDHVKMSTQPLELTPRREQLIEVLEAFGGMEDLLCFASDYPHWDADDPFYITTRLPRRWLPKVFHDNARSFLRLKETPVAGGARV
jgi:uncharacterized protein